MGLHSSRKSYEIAGCSADEWSEAGESRRIAEAHAGCWLWCGAMEGQDHASVVDRNTHHLFDRVAGSRAGSHVARGVVIRRGNRILKELRALHREGEQRRQG